MILLPVHFTAQNLLSFEWWRGGLKKISWKCC